MVTNFQEERADVVQGIATEEVTDCAFCGRPGQPLYTGLTDRLSCVQGSWNFLVCSSCELVWLTPRPIPSDIGKAYKAYFTHGEEKTWSLWDKTRRALYSASVPGYSTLVDGWLWTITGTILAQVPALRERALLGTMCLASRKRGKLLDIGCGNGTFLSRMREAGWEVIGIEPDPMAARRAQARYGINVVAGSLEDAKLPDSSFDAISLSHVIEHVHDPITLLAACRRILKPRGLVTVLTPNVQSLGHNAFASCWFALEPPRHLWLFSANSLRACCEKAGLQVETLRTSSRMGYWIAYASETIRKNGRFLDSAVTRRSRIRALAFELREQRALRHSRLAGEELVLTASTP